MYRISIITILMCLCFFAKSQDKAQQDFPLKISLLDESITLPNANLFKYSFNPAIVVGTEYVLKEKNKHAWLLTANLGFYHHKDWQTAIFIHSELMYRQQWSRWSLRPKLGLGYTHAFANKPLYGLEDGTWQGVKDNGHPLLMTSLGVEIAYQLANTGNSPEVFLNYMGVIELPLNIYTSGHQFVGVGIKVFPFKGK